MEPPTDVAGSEELLGVAAVEFIVGEGTVVSPSTLRLAVMMPLGSKRRLLIQSDVSQALTS